MKIFILSILFSVNLFASEQPKVDSCAHSKNDFRCVKYLSNYDGDTIRFEIPNVHPLLGHKIAIRVRGLDAGEMRTKNACEKSAAYIARDLVKSKLSVAKKINLKNIERGKYFRIVADVEIDGVDLKQVVMNNGLAYEYGGKTKSKIDWCDKLKRLPASLKGSIHLK